MATQTRAPRTASPALLLLVGLAAGVRTGSALVPGPDLVALNSTKGANRLKSATHDAPYWQLMNHFETQTNQAYCSVATSVTILNALSSQGVPAPRTPALWPYAYWTQEALTLSPCFKAVPTHDGDVLSDRYIATHGATLDEWAAYLSCFASVTAVHAADASVGRLRDDVRAAFGAWPPRFAAVNFARAGMHESGGGHMSPLGAYDAASDSVLLLDVSRYKYPPVWVPLPLMFESLNTVDSSSNATRGYVVVSPRAEPPELPATAQPDPSLVRACIRGMPTDDWLTLQRCLTQPQAQKKGNGSAPAAAPPAPCAPAPAPAPPSKGGANAALAVSWLITIGLLGVCAYLMYLLRLQRAVAGEPAGSLLSVFRAAKSGGGAANPYGEL